MVKKALYILVLFSSLFLFSDHVNAVSDKFFCEYDGTVNLIAGADVSITYRVYPNYEGNNKIVCVPLDSLDGCNIKLDKAASDTLQEGKCPKYGYYHSNFFGMEMTVTDDPSSIDKKYFNKSLTLDPNRDPHTNVSKDPNNNNNNSNGNNNIFDSNISSNECLIFGPKTASILKTVFFWMKLAIPIILIILTMMDFLTAITSSDEKLNKVFKKFITRLLLTVIFFLLPFILELLLNFINKSTEMCVI